MLSVSFAIDQDWDICVAIFRYIFHFQFIMNDMKNVFVWETQCLHFRTNRLLSKIISWIESMVSCVDTGICLFSSVTSFLPRAGLNLVTQFLMVRYWSANSVDMSSLHCKGTMYCFCMFSFSYRWAIIVVCSGRIQDRNC